MDALQDNPDIQTGSPKIQSHMETFQGLLAGRITTDDDKQRLLHTIGQDLGRCRTEKEEHTGLGAHTEPLNPDAYMEQGAGFTG